MTMNIITVDVGNKLYNVISTSINPNDDIVDYEFSTAVNGKQQILNVKLSSEDVICARQVYGIDVEGELMSFLQKEFKSEISKLIDGE
jgi:hypothetical protein